MEEEKDPQKVGEEVASNAAQKFGLFCVFALIADLVITLLLLLFFGNKMSYEFLNGLSKFFGWSVPILFAGWVASANFCANIAEKNIKNKK